MDDRKLLIVNADDCNLTEGVSKAILECHDQGIVRSTSFLINLSIPKGLIQALKKRKELGVGLHLNVTLGEPVSAVSRVASLIKRGGGFKKKSSLCRVLPKREELYLEWKNQILKFRKSFMKLPTHLDTHHQLHDYPFYFKVFKQLAREYRLPVRRSKLMRRGWASLKTTDKLYGSLSPQSYWRERSFLQCLRKVTSGIHEMMCHPGIVDADLRAVSSFTKGREVERKIFRSKKIKKMIHLKGFIMTHYGVCYNP